MRQTHQTPMLVDTKNHLLRNETDKRERDAEKRVPPQKGWKSGKEWKWG